MRHNASRTDDGTVADGYTAENHGVSSDPYPVADPDGCSGSDVGFASGKIDRMSSRVNGNIRPEQTVISDGNLGNVQNRAVIVAKEVVSDMDMFAEVTGERGIEIRSVSQRSMEDFTYFSTARSNMREIA